VVTNAPVYGDTELFAAFKGFIVQIPGPNSINNLKFIANIGVNYAQTSFIRGRHNTQHNCIQPNGTWHIGTRHTET
jgi:hypothetical protein